MMKEKEAYNMYVYAHREIEKETYDKTKRDLCT
jgi:hypothetical protein